MPAKKQSSRRQFLTSAASLVGGTLIISSSPAGLHSSSHDKSQNIADNNSQNIFRNSSQNNLERSLHENSQDHSLSANQDASFMADPGIGDVMDRFIKDVPGAPFPTTVDTLKSGTRETKVTGIVTTMFATIEIIRKAIALKANFIIAHEPTFYNHLDQTEWLENDPVYQFKAGLLKQHNIAVWRNHDYVHSLKTDGVRKQLIEQLGWNRYETPGQPIYVPDQPLMLSKLIQEAKAKLGIDQVRYMGDLNQTCQKILLMPGAAGGKPQISNIIRYKPDVLVCGEVSEWETAEYVRDARAKGDKLALVVLGHIASEEPGSVFMADWLKQNFSQIKTTHIPSGNSLSFA